MKIILVHNYYRHRGGEDAAFEKEAKLLRDAGHEVTTWTKNSNQHLSLASQAKVLANMRHSRVSKLKFKQLLDQVSPDLVHCHNLFPVISPSIYDACQNLAIPIVQTLHNFRMRCASALLLRDGHPCELCWSGSTLPAIRYSCYQNSRIKTIAVASMIESLKRRDSWSKVNRFIALSHFSASKFIEAGIDSSKISIKSNFVEITELPEPKIHENTFALFVGRLSEEKGIEVLRKAWSGLSIPLKIVGDGPLAGTVQNQPNIECLGQLHPSQVLSLMRKASFLVLPTICYENFPLVLAEAFSQSLPVVASDIGSVKEIVNPNVGLLFEPNSMIQLQEKANILWANQTLRKTLSSNAYEEYQKNYTSKKNLSELEKIYQKTLIEK